MSRDEFLRRVRQSVESGRKFRCPVPPVSPAAGYVGTDQDLCTALAAEVNGLGGVTQIVDDWPTAQAHVVELLHRYEVRSAFCWRHDSLDRLGLSTILSERGITLQDHSRLAGLSRDEQRYIVLHTEIGITAVDVAVAETGTLVVCSGEGQERMASLVPPVHLAVIEEAKIVPDLFDLFDHLSRLGAVGLPSNVALISGPSKTGDIELELTTGVHGPGKLHVLIVRSQGTTGR